MKPAFISMKTILPNTPEQKPGFKSGQIFLGKVNKIFPNQTAEVQIGSQKIIASLDVPLKAGSSYLLQVQPDQGMVHLKLIDTGTSNSAGGSNGSAEQLLKLLSSPASRESMDLAGFMLKNQLPVTKDSFEQILSWMKTAENEGEAFMAIKTMHTSGLPFVKDVFQALLAHSKGEPIHRVLSGLLKQLEGSHTETSLKTRSLIISMMYTAKERLMKDPLPSIIASWMDPLSSEDDNKAAFSILQKTGLISADKSEPEVIGDLFRNPKLQAQAESAGILPFLKEAQNMLTRAKSVNAGNQEALKPVLDRLISLVNSAFDAGAAANGEEITADHAIPVNLVNADMETGGLPRKLLQAVQNLLEKNEPLLKGFPDKGTLLLSLLNANSAEGAAEKAANLLMKAMNGNPADNILPKNELLLLGSLAENALSEIDSSHVSAPRFLKDAAKLLGLNHEHFIGQPEETGRQPFRDHPLSLKSLLLQLVTEDHPKDVKDTAALLINKITAQQILSQENGPLQNVYMQLPVALPGFQTDVSIQWSGRKKEDGSIDPDYCRILFYLDLQQLKETVIDMKVQNRVIKITVMNEQHREIEQLSGAFISLLKGKIENLNYQLSAIKFSAWSNSEQGPGINSFGQGAKIPYKGLDLRV
ncbi:hypothetical protein [Bacillus sp. MUM 13]|uniref:hypothetical protein n=1 Tax=Bacillus sp. MUM 13 TaxID=1678001 RepID=UPI0008F57B52|nr:hypothetical protein [Bacillus sp. MUM 13]OIK15262.1 hypothetical protein BIV59_00570 [Bacillus sp. MUM 13]